MKIDVLGMGSAAIDLVIRCEDLPREDGFSFVHDESRVPGGSCSNLLTVIAAMGGSCAILAKTGSDNYGNEIKTDLERAGVSTEYLITKEGGVSMHTIVAVAKNGARSIFVNLGDSFLSLSENEVSSDMIDNIKILYTDMFNGKPSLKLARYCVQRSIPVVFNLECSIPFMELCGVSLEEIEEMISYSYLFCTGREGLNGLTPVKDAEEAAAYVYEKYKPRGGVAVTSGEAGAFWLGQGGTIKVPAFTIEPVDTTGAGDAFAGGLIYSHFLKKQDIRSSLIFANACGALKCTQNGPRLKLDERTVLEFIESGKVHV